MALSAVAEKLTIPEPSPFGLLSSCPIISKFRVILVGGIKFPNSLFSA